MIVPFLPKHLEDMDILDNQAYIKDYDLQEYVHVLNQGSAFSVIKDGLVIGIFGVLPLTISRSQAWALMSKQTNKYMLYLTRQVKSYFDTLEFIRIETPVLDEFKEGHRWVKMLGFINETPNGMKNYGDSGETFHLYARYK